MRSGIAHRLAPGAARHADYLLYSCKESNQRKHAPVCRPLRGCPALLDWSGGFGTRATRSNSPRRHPLTSLRYSAAHRGNREAGFCVRKRTLLVIATSVANATLVGDGYRYAPPILPRCLARVNAGGHELHRLHGSIDAPPSSPLPMALRYILSVALFHSSSKSGQIISTITPLFSNLHLKVSM